MLEYIIVGLIIAIALYAGGRSLWRTWTGQDTNGCAGCTSCSSSSECNAARMQLLQKKPSADSVKPSCQEVQQ
ncbi:MAG: FeoB-associated Cys-rich membrane protein [Lentisphaerae bacterium]|jgi:TPP-dependent indolepyruvate ferredoxin oxidoreductase alpha subunit|nr:FeoB-associated Cys-rich membrane protein [Lentisphaerota bacterium]